MRLMIITALLLIAGQASASEQVISVQHDSVRGVTCWILNDKGISCLPDSSLLQQATPSSDAGRASQASSAQEKASLVSIPLPQDERFRL
ncbi:hypothetical protein [Pseudomonas koreensis]|uniref:Uncharacterized protein n=1 Tax=Pseudomonas koreensis TaxID=198620 RepID=A0AA94EPQ0_9PSED|nr:hypothetical protein [Pseudomonas koreensis]RVD78201.1 hypothetical protein A9HBioS_2046 [Pseudomonas koreensis]